jgi:hypothetical protein
MKMSPHAQQRATEMGVTFAEIESVRLYHVREYFSLAHSSRNYVGRRITVSVREMPNGAEIVTTVLWSDEEAFGILSPNRVPQQYPRSTP